LDKNTLDDIILEDLEEASSFSTPLSAYNAIVPYNSSLSSRDVKYQELHEMYENTFTRDIVKVIIARAIGTEHNDVTLFEIGLEDTANMSKLAIETVKEEFKYLRKIISKNLLQVVLDAQIYGDGYVSLHSEESEGITRIIFNEQTKPFNIIPYVSNFGNFIACETRSNPKFGHKKAKGGRNFISSKHIARMNANANGIMVLQTESLMSVDNMNPFTPKETIYQDFVYGGVMEGCKESFDNFIYAINALANARLSSSIVERFIIHNMGSLSENERTLLKNALVEQLKGTMKKMKEKVDKKDPTAGVVNYTIPTTGDGTNSVEIQESNVNFDFTTDDLLMHVKRYIGDIGFNFDMTSYSTAKEGGYERDGSFENSLQMEVQGQEIRDSITEYIISIVKVHFATKFNQEIDPLKIKVEYKASVNKAKLNDIRQTQESIGNAREVSTLLTELKEAGYKNNDGSRHLLKEILKDVVSNTANDKEALIETMIDHVLNNENTNVGEENA